jgi:hypothetical protein
MSMTRCPICQYWTAPCAACMSAHLRAQMPRPIAVGLYENPEDIRAKFAALTAERDALKEDRDNWQHNSANAAPIIDALKAEVERLKRDQRDALKAEVAQMKEIVDKWGRLIAACPPTSIKQTTTRQCDKCGSPYVWDKAHIDELINSREVLKSKMGEMTKALEHVSVIVFDTYSNAQKLPWEAIEQNCRQAVNIIKDALA